jgi:hypothetical protein
MIKANTHNRLQQKEFWSIFPQHINGIATCKVQVGNWNKVDITCQVLRPEKASVILTLKLRANGQQLMVALRPPRLSSFSSVSLGISTAIIDHDTPINAYLFWMTSSGRVLSLPTYPLKFVDLMTLLYILHIKYWRLVETNLNPFLGKS